MRTSWQMTPGNVYKRLRRKVMDKKMETVVTLVELNDEELKAVAGGFFNGSFTNFSNGGNAPGGNASGTGSNANGSNASGGNSTFA